MTDYPHDSPGEPANIRELARQRAFAELKQKYFHAAVREARAEIRNELFRDRDNPPPSAVAVLERLEALQRGTDI